MSVSEMKERISGYLTLAVIGVETVDDAFDTVNAFIASVATTEAVINELHDYKAEVVLTLGL